MNSWASEVIAEPRDMQKTGDESIIDGVMSGLIRQNDTAEERFVPKLISNQPGSTMGDAIREELKGSESFDISVAFVSENALKSMYQAFVDHAKKSRKRNRIITSTKNYFNSPKAFKELMKLQRDANMEVLIWEHGDSGESGGTIAQDQLFHPKGYLFTRRMEEGRAYYNLYVGSSNLTSFALQNQREWNLRVSSTSEAQLIQQVKEELADQVRQSVPLTDEWLAQYEEEFKNYAPPRAQILHQARAAKIEPNAMQRDALASIRQLRDEGQRRAIVISATGTGKTYLSAFDVREFHPKRMLYVANRDTILKAARESYQRVLGCDEAELGLLTGSSKQHDAKYVFASVDTLRRHMEEWYESDDFDYVLIDEAHHSGANNYRSVIDYFSEARFMLGMTATPERTDSFDIFALFDHNIAYEIRLQKALDENMLCPFHYYGVHEFLGDDGARVDSAEGISKSDKRQIQYSLEELTEPSRVRYIIRKLEQYGSYGQQVTGLVFCSRIDEAEQLSHLFNQETNQQAERPYRTVAISGKTSPKDVENAVNRLEAGELDYIFTVDKFNEGIDIPAINQIVMLRNTESSIVFTQQLGRGLRKFPHKTCVTVIDFIGNYANNYLIPVALYGNAGDSDIVRKNLQREAVGLSSISFDEISRKQVLKSLDTASWSDKKMLREQYSVMRNELGRIPMLTDVYRHDPSMVMTMAQKNSSYFDFAREAETVLSDEERGSGFAHTLLPVDAQGEQWLKMATEILLVAIRPQELVVLDELLTSCNKGVYSPISVLRLKEAVATRFPASYHTDAQFESALRVLDWSFFDTAAKKSYGECAVIERSDGGISLAPEFAARLVNNDTFRRFFVDNVRTGLKRFADLLEESAKTGHSLQDDRGFVYEHRYKMFEVERLLAWPKQINGSSVGGYLLPKEGGSMPVFVKYANSQYADRFLNPQEMHWFSKDKRSFKSREIEWMAQGQGDADWGATHFIPLFVMRKADAEKLKMYYYVGRVGSCANMRETARDNSGETVRLVEMDLRLTKPLSAELYQHLTGQIDA
ncbi:RNA helicase [Bifidobacterium pseudolongum PV8-2]|uniref:RNA helicase n=3 Tax=Bifidobacterium pseudolongum TaxID=1694 RepID=A0A0A7I9Z2_9BIFI|nr:RNA helicase [Bifidobacterium pseudolongum PV8-2]PKV00619.1 RNA helicase [Bifidobacterium pseudolongum subsp. globosum]RYQ37805.1 RNA helicase [Bifidobacterium pseudolongum subsp. globosum]RYQ56279.1 RNA helicase [Bifidobacterium pseudolongum subsp. globosum]RYQ71803.1 RNA helicase [Bifidobacterium pseudolongum subsp. globosum]